MFIRRLRSGRSPFKTTLVPEGHSPSAHRAAKPLKERFYGDLSETIRGIGHRAQTGEITNVPNLRTAMKAEHIPTDYIDRAIAGTEYIKLDGGSFAGRISSCNGVVAFGVTLKECEVQLRSTLEDWILVGLKLGHRLPIIDGIDLNKKPE
jgi:hypothetical protein